MIHFDHISVTSIFIQFTMCYIEDLVNTDTLVTLKGHSLCLGVIGKTWNLYQQFGVVFQVFT